MTRFFRYSYIINGRGSVRGKSRRYTVHSVFFSFSKDEELEELAYKEAWEIFEEVNPKWFIVTEGEEFEEVSSGEASGIGFYFLHVLLNDRVVRKVHLRRGLREAIFFDVVPVSVKSVLRGL